MDPVSGIAFALTLAQGVDLCLKYGQALIEKYKSYKNANQRVTELIIRVQGVWLKTEYQLRFLQKISESLSGRLIAYQQQVVEELYIKLQESDLRIERFIGDENRDSVQLLPWKRAKYALIEKDLRNSVTILEEWHARFDPSWYMISLIADSNIDQQLMHSPKDESFSSLQQIRNEIYKRPTPRASMFRDPDFIYEPVQVSSGVHIAKTLDGSLVIVDCTDYPETTEWDLATVHVSDLARLLSTSEPNTLGLLKCLGVIRGRNQLKKSQYEFLFAVPQELRTPCSLRELLLGPSVSLDNKVHIAKRLARSVLAVHVAGLVHKNIRPETILIFKDDAKSLHSYLIGFERFRPQASGSNFVGDMLWERNLYRHPKRQGMVPEELYTMHHDLYSFGVCLLEIGLWTSFVVDHATEPHPTAELSAPLAIKNLRERASAVKQRLLGLATQQLPGQMGDAYAGIVTSCITCLDGGSTGLVTGGVEDDDVTLGVIYLEKILMRLEQIAL